MLDRWHARASTATTSAWPPLTPQRARRRARRRSGRLNSVTPPWRAQQPVFCHRAHGSQRGYADAERRLGERISSESFPSSALMAASSVGDRSPDPDGYASLRPIRNDRICRWLRESVTLRVWATPKRYLLGSCAHPGQSAGPAMKGMTANHQGGTLCVFRCHLGGLASRQQASTDYLTRIAGCKSRNLAEPGPERQNGRV
jgi:hypothetical protein